jgi:hypothetical protein
MMNLDDDEAIGQRLRALAPATRDPLFRIKVLERRERRQFRRRVAFLLGGTVGATTIYAIASIAANGTPRGLGIALVLAMAATMYVPALLKITQGLGK